MPKSNSQQKNTPDARTRRQQVGAERRGAGGIAEGGDRPEGPESSRREAFFKLWESGKINRLEHTAGGSRKTNTTWCHLYVESRKAKLIETESSYQGLWVGKGEILVKEYNIPVKDD